MMRNVILIILIIFQTSSLYAQSSRQKVNLYQKVDSIIRYQLGYTYDSTTDKPPIYYIGTSTKKSKFIHCYPTISPNPSPRILLNGYFRTLQELKLYAPLRIKEIIIFQKDSTATSALFGSSGKNGAIIIRTKRRWLIKKRKNKVKN